MPAQLREGVRSNPEQRDNTPATLCTGQRMSVETKLSNVLAVEGAKNNIKSNVIAPIARTRLTEDLLGPLAEKLDPANVTPLVVYLSSEANEETHAVYSVGGGRFARIFIGLAPGWTKLDGAVSVEEIQANFAQIHEPGDFIIPASIGDEMGVMAKALAG